MKIFGICTIPNFIAKRLRVKGAKGVNIGVKNNPFTVADIKNANGKMIEAAKKCSDGFCYSVNMNGKKYDFNFTREEINAAYAQAMAEVLGK